MKKAIFLAIVLLSSVPVWAATPLRNGIYLNAKAGAMRTQVKSESTSAKDVVFPFALALGARMYHFRVEAEYTFSTKVKKDNFQVQTETTMAQLYYDVPLKTFVRPFFNVGIGRHNTKVKETGVFSESRRGWAYDFGAGFTCNVSNATNIDIGYRYLKVKDIKTQGGTIKPTSHMMYIGWRYVF